ncbi:MAG: energy transducer TonB, partial [Bacteroidales bacterium]|nr:energy transducer TonB [Bacteroidales bacterium]
MSFNKKYPSRFLFGLITILFLPGLAFGQDKTPPKFITSQRLIKAYIEEEMVYPETALNNKTEGEVIIKFKVDEKGKTSNPQIIRSVSPELNKEAIRIFSKILWKPATFLNTPVSAEQTFSVKFNLKKYKKYCKKRGYDKLTYPIEPVEEGYQIYKLKQVDHGPRPALSSLNCTLNSFINKNLKYPDVAFKQNISGTVKLKFVIETTGRISNIVAEQKV